MKESFNQLYTRLYRENYKEFEKIKDEKRNKVVITIVLIIIFVILRVISLNISMVFVIGVIMWLLIRKSRNNVTRKNVHIVKTVKDGDTIIPKIPITEQNKIIHKEIFVNGDKIPEEFLNQPNVKITKVSANGVNEILKKRIQDGKIIIPKEVLNNEHQIQEEFLENGNLVIPITEDITRHSDGKVVRRVVGRKKLSYKGLFKEKIIGPIIENVFEGAMYNPNDGIDYAEYRKAGFKDDIDSYLSEDLIVAPLNMRDGSKTIANFSEVHTMKEHKDKDGNVSYSTEFHGLAGYFKLSQNINRRIYIRTNGRVTDWGTNKVDMDMSEFEKMFDVESYDKNITMRILTADVMTEMVDVYEKYKYKFEISIVKDTVYMRIRTGELFEPSIFKNAMEYKELEKYYMMLKSLISIANNMYHTISKLEI